MMLKKDRQRAFELFLIFGFLFLSNASAFLGVIWLIPSVIFLLVLLWLGWTVALLWRLHQQPRLVDFLPVLRTNWFIMPFWLFSGLSILWSIDPLISFQRWVILCCTILAGGYMAAKCDIKRLIDVLCVFGIFILGVSMLLVIFAPNLGVMNYYSIQDAWRGVYWHKNHLGLIATFFSLLFLIRVIDGIWFKGANGLLWALLYLCSLVYVVKSDSAAAYITTIFSHGAVFLMLFWVKFRDRIRPLHYAIFLFMIVCGFIVLYVNLDVFFGVFNRNAGLTGRVPMWSHLFERYLSAHPLGGYGFHAFWHTESHRVTMQRLEGYPDPIVIADNGFIDILMNTGYLGLAIFFIFFLGTWWRSLKHASKAGEMSGFFPLILMIFVFLANLTWSLIFESEGFFMLLMVATLVIISTNSSTGRNEGKTSEINGL